jgi:recombination protein RecA
MSTNLQRGRHGGRSISKSRRSPAYRRAIDLRAAIDELRSRFGPTIIRQASDLAIPPAGAERAALSTGSLGLDLITSGLPRGGITEYAGRDGAGRETLAATAVARAQAAGGLIVLVDPGGTADPEALTAVGIDLSALTLAYPSTLVQAESIVDVLCRCGAVDLLLISSFSSLLVLPASRGITRPERLLARWRSSLRGRRTSLLLVNHAVSEAPWSTMEERAVAQDAVLRVGLRARGVHIDADGEVAGLLSEAQVIKYLGRPHRPVIELLMRAGGPDAGRELLTLAHLVGCLEETALGLVVGSQLLGRSNRRAARTLGDDTDLAALVEERIRVAWTARHGTVPA